MKNLRGFLLQSQLKKLLLIENPSIEIKNQIDELKTEIEQINFKDMEMTKKQLDENEDNEMITGNELMHMRFPDPIFLIDKILPVGLTILSGDPKTGKSKLTRQIILSVLQGENLMNKFKSGQGQVLYIPLEEGLASINRQLKKMLLNRNIEDHSFLQSLFIVQRPDLEEKYLDLEDFIQEYYFAHKHLKLVVLDPLAGLMYEDAKSGYNYVYDYKQTRKLQDIAIDLGISLIAVTHNRKSDSKKMIHKVSGTQGITGAAEAVWEFNREDNSTIGHLTIKGRELEEDLIVLNFDKSTLEWVYGGKEFHLNVTPEENEYVELFYLNHESGLKNSEIADKLKKDAPLISYFLKKLKNKNILVKFKNGVYKLDDEIYLKLKESKNQNIN